MIATCQLCGASLIQVFTQDGATLALDTTPVPGHVMSGWVVDGVVAHPYDPLTDHPVRTRYQAHSECCPSANRESAAREPT